MSISSLLLAHHEDDQAETVLMRMISGHRLAGLAGIREVTEIPENYGFYGVHESGGSNQVTVAGGAMKPYRASLGSNSQAAHHLMCEDGGIKIYRPMLGFSKARLIATCEVEEMKWFEDHTNKDPTLTTRNAIRHIYANYKMPAGLSKSSLLNLSAKVRGKLTARKAVVDGWMSTDSITGFDTCAGTLTIRFPHISQLGSSSNWSVSEKSQIAAELLRRILMLVTPEEHVELASLHGAVARLFPEINVNEVEKESATTGFTVAGVQFQPEIPRIQESVQPKESNSEKELHEPISDGPPSQIPLEDRPLPDLLNQPYSTGVDPIAPVTKVFSTTYFQQLPSHKGTYSDENIEANLNPDSVCEKHLNKSRREDSRKPQWFLSRQPFPVHRPQSLNIGLQIPTSGGADLFETIPRQMAVEGKLEKGRYMPKSSGEELPTNSSSFHPRASAPTVMQGQVALNDAHGFGLALEKEREPSRETRQKTRQPSALNNVPRTQAGHPKLGSHLHEALPPRQFSESRGGQKQGSPKSSKLVHSTSNKPRPLIIVPPATTRSEITWSPWTLFDGRYWIRVQNLSDARLLIKPFEREHLMSFKHKNSKLYRDYFQKILRTVARGNVRWTLPAIVLDTQSWTEGRFERVVALPTLDIHIENAHELVKWEVRYKKIYLDRIPLAPALVPPSVSVGLLAKRVNRAELKCIGCGLGGHIYEECWKIYPELKPEAIRLRAEQRASVNLEGPSTSIEMKRMKKLRKKESMKKKISVGKFEKETLARIQNHVKGKLENKGAEREEATASHLEESKFENNATEAKVEAQAESLDVKPAQRVTSRGSGSGAEGRQTKWPGMVEEIINPKRETMSELGEGIERGTYVEQPAKQGTKTSESRDPKSAGAARQKKWAYWAQRNQERVAKRERRRQARGNDEEEK